MAITRTFVILEGEDSGTSIPFTTQDSTGQTHAVLVVKHESGSGVSITPSDNKGSGTWTSIAREDDGSLALEIFWVKIGSPGTGHDVTVTFSASADFHWGALYWINSGTGEIEVDAFANDQGSGTAIDLGSLATSGASVVSIMGVAESTSTTFTAGSGWSLDESSQHGAQSRAAESTSPIDPVMTSSASMDWVGVAASFAEATAFSTDQEGFAFGDDDGNEASHTLDTQDTNVTDDLGTAKTLRVLVDSTGDAPSTAYTLRAQKNGSGGYVAVPVGASNDITPVIEVADCTESGNNTPTTSWGVSYPAYVNGDLLIFHVASDADVTHDWPATGPNGETINTIVDSTGGTTQRASGFWFVGTATTGAGTLTVTPSASEQWTAVVLKVPAGEFYATTPIQASPGTANDTTADANWETPAWTADSRANGRVVCFAAIDLVTTANATAGWTALIERDRGAVGCSLVYRDAANTASESISSVDIALVSSETDSSFGYVINAPTITNELYITASANFASGGEATTARLTAPSGKNSGTDFDTGRRWDDENGSDPTNLTTDHYTELEWVLATQSPASGGDFWDFRVYAGSSPLSSYGVTPRLTLSSGSSLTASSGTLTLAGAPTSFSVAQAATAGGLSLIGSSAGLIYGVLVADPGPLTLTSSATFPVSLGASAGVLSLGGGTVSFTEVIRLTASPGSLLLGGGVAFYGRGIVASPGSLFVDGADILISASITLDAENGTLLLTAQDSLVDLVLETAGGTLSLSGAVTFPEGFLAEEGALTLVGANAILTSTSQTAVAANPGGLLLGSGATVFQPQLTADGGALLLAGGTAALSVLQLAARGTVSLVGSDAVFDTDTITDADRGTLLLSGTVDLKKTLSTQPGSLVLGGGVATLTATQVNQIVANPGTLLFVGADVTLVVTGLTWEGDDATWGGSIAMFGETLPVFVIGQSFYQAGNANAFELDPIEVILERTGLTIESVDREGKPRSNPYSVKLLREIWPVFRATPGTVIQVYAGAQDLPEEGVRWQGPFEFTVGQSRSVQPLIEGVYLAVRYRSFGQGPWHLLSHDFDIVPLGVLPQ